MRTRAAPMRSARAIRKGLRGFIGIYRPVIGPYAKEATVSHAMQRKR